MLTANTQEATEDCTQKDLRRVVSHKQVTGSPS